jgi:hypothetical protein
MDPNQIRGLGALVLLFCLLWSEESERGGTSIFSNKAVVVDLGGLRRIQDLQAFPASRGDGKESDDFLAIPASFLLAGLGGEGENDCGRSLCAPATRSRSVDGFNLTGNSSSSSSLTRRGGEKEDDLSRFFLGMAPSLACEVLHR